ncbi:UbiA family prenyltransferase [Novosphingobium rosa]|uniref:UbiA family prenyltransferase n=1 Tax=Novosphingobium rosa TaxID=76978 RepID=UPI0008374E99|nr:UbiA family prenyltransferase [Novosphingobium rosa]
MNSLPRPETQAPLVVDLDQTLVRGDMALEGLVKVIGLGVRAWFTLLALLLRGPAPTKAWLARRLAHRPSTLVLREPVTAQIAEARREGRPVILATAAHWRVARRVAALAGPFDAVLASSYRRNLKGRTKLAAIQAHVGGPFDYIGDSPADRPIWQASRIAYTVGVETGVAQQQRLAPQSSPARALIRALRPHQWAKNVLVFLPLATSGELAHPGQIGHALLSFICLSLIASSVYLVNDLLDIDADRIHPKKRRRPLAAGDLSIPLAVVAALIGTAVGLGAGLFWLGWPAFAALATYCVLTVTYSLRLKAAMIADVLALACLYTLRIAVGAAAIHVPVSFWLLLFSVFLFLSLGYLKRYIELRGSLREEHELLSGRGYTPSDEMIVAMNGVAAGMVSLLVLALFAEAMGRSGTYASPEMLWLLPLPLLYWLNRVWMMARRGEVDGDPVAFAITDKKSLTVGLLLGLILLLAKFAALPIG